jgi:Sulfotransferase domain
MSRRVPEILIIGTMKGGTTALWTALRRHPSIAMAATKEIHYFTMYAEQSMDWYVNQFPDRQSHVFAVDASPTYFDTAKTVEIPERISNAIPDCRLILCVRDPVERAVSHYYHVKRAERTKSAFHNVEMNEFFERGLRGEVVTQSLRFAHINYAMDFGIYDKKYENYLKVFGAPALLVVENEEIVRDMNSVMDKVLKHCRLAPSLIDYNARRYTPDRREEELAPSIRQELSNRLYPSYDRFRLLVGLPSILRG